MNKVYRTVHIQRAHWVIFSPTLMAYPFSTNYIQDEGHRRAIESLLTDLDSKSKLVNQHFQSLGKMPMGKYFEQLLLFVLNQDDRYEVMLSNYQVIQNKQTVGELDVAVKDNRTGLIEHWEVCLKYYLQQVPSNQHEVMLGPNAIDNLDRKMNKLINHQLTLGSHPNILKRIDSQNVDSNLFMKGQFFYHFNQNQVDPVESNHNHEQGWWCFLNEVDQLIVSLYKWTTIWKPDWIGPVYRKDSSDLITDDQMKTRLSNHFKNENHSVLCVGMREENGLWIEATRGFVVNNYWPNPNPSKG